MFSAQALENFIKSLEVMWMGMLGIFTVIVIIMAIVFVLTKINSPKAGEEE